MIELQLGYGGSNSISLAFRCLRRFERTSFASAKHSLGSNILKLCGCNTPHETANCDSCRHSECSRFTKRIGERGWFNAEQKSWAHFLQ